MGRASARVDAAMLEARAAVLAKRSLKAAAKRAGIDLVISCLDLTTLEGRDTPGQVRAVCARAIAPASGAPSVAAVCIYPAYAAHARAALAGSSVKVASVSGAFPSGHSPLEVKVAETRAAVAAGAQEVDVVLDRGALLAGDIARARAEIVALREAAGPATLKVILETGELGSYSLIRRACDVALEAGADFLKTSTGKIGVAATPAVALLICEALREHFRKDGRAVGLKVAGGIRTTRAAFAYLAIVKETLGDAWLHSTRFRLGASALLDDLLLQRDKEASGAYAGSAYVATV
ncbi:MAG TPA: deoxyribose-phosphate aldolase [Candidatus Baltobacteraceae bacterium]|nr:deoxyribose-phosphate aldolase [Candidatus Baltobacteraceae bacterium]